MLIRLSVLSAILGGFNEGRPKGIVLICTNKNGSGFFRHIHLQKN